MELTKNLFIIIVLISSNVQAENYFCNLRCGAANAACDREPCPRSAMCGEYFESITLTEKDKAKIVLLHNDFRHALAEGVFHQLPPGSNINSLSYDEELAFVAQCWANSCRPGHERCVSTSQFKYVAQNLAVISEMSQNEDYGSLVAYAFTKFWFREIALVSYLTVNPKTSVRLGNTNAIINIMCAKLTHIGCAAVKYGKIKYIRLLIVCNYGPNTCGKTDHLYKPGPIGKQCETQRTEPNGLCSPNNERMKMLWVPPFKIITSSANIKNHIPFLFVIFTLLFL